MQLEAALLNKIITDGDLDTWAELQEHYIPETAPERAIFKLIEKEVNNRQALPTWEALSMMEPMPEEQKEHIASLKTLEVGVEPHILLDFLKNKFTQSEILKEVEIFLGKTILTEDAQEQLDTLQDIVLNVEDKVEVESEANNMRTLELFDSDDEIKKRLPLGLNEEYDQHTTFSPTNLILLGAKSSGGKSFTCSSIAASLYNGYLNYPRKSILYFTIEMDSREIMQRIAAQCSGVPLGLTSPHASQTGVPREDYKEGTMYRRLYPKDWEKLATWWAGRYENGEEILKEVLEQEPPILDAVPRQWVGWDMMTAQLKTLKKDSPSIEIYYDPKLSLTKIMSVTRNKMKTMHDPGVIIVDYINQVKRGIQNRAGQYDWTEQIEISKALKGLAQEVECMVITACQTNPEGEIKFSRDLQNAVDAFYLLEKHDPGEVDDVEPEEDYGEKPAETIGQMKFICKKLRNGTPKPFISEYNLNTLKIGPKTGFIKQEVVKQMDKEDEEKKTKRTSYSDEPPWN